MKLTPEIIVIGTGATLANAQLWLGPIARACAKWKITSTNSVAAFLSNIGVESASLTALVENLNYSAQGLANTWPTRFSVNSKATPLVPTQLAQSIARKPEQIANAAYANRMGNGDAASGDGWRYRGRGLKQVTGKDNYRRCGQAIGFDFVSDPDQMATSKEYAADSAAWFFASNGLIELSDNGEISKVIKVINGAAPSDVNKGPLRIKRYMDVKKSAIDWGDQK